MKKTILEYNNFRNVETLTPTKFLKNKLKLCERVKQYEIAKNLFMQTTQGDPKVVMKKLLANIKKKLFVTGNIYKLSDRLFLQVIEAMDREYQKIKK